MIIFLANNVNFPKFTFNILSNLIDLSCVTILHWFEPFVMSCKSMPSNIACFLRRKQTVICTTSQLNSVNMIENRIDLVVLYVENILTVEIWAVNEYQLHTRLFWGVSRHIVELLGDPFTISVLHKYYHQYVRVFHELFIELLLGHKGNISCFLLYYFEWIRQIIESHIVIGIKNFHIEHISE